MSNINKVETNFGCIAFALLVIFCLGEPDIIDGIVYKLTGVKLWECASDNCVLNKPLASP